jgi:hypothetical protein
MTAPARDYSLTGPESQRAIERGLADAEWYRSPIDPARLAELHQRSDLRVTPDDDRVAVVANVRPPPHRGFAQQHERGR